MNTPLLLRQLRLRSGRTFTELAAAAGCSRTLLSLIETGKRRLVASGLASVRVPELLDALGADQAQRAALLAAAADPQSQPVPSHQHDSKIARVRPVWRQKHLGDEIAAEVRNHGIEAGQLPVTQ